MCLVPSRKYPNIKSAYDSIVKYIDKQLLQKEYYFTIPEIWLKRGVHKNNLFEFNYPISIRLLTKILLLMTVFYTI